MAERIADMDSKSIEAATENIKLKEENAALKTENVNLKEENMALKERVAAMEKRQQKVGIKLRVAALVKRQQKGVTMKKQPCAVRPLRASKENKRHKRVISKKNSYTHVKSRVYASASNFSERFQQHADEKKKREVAGCTFQPTLVGGRQKKRRHKSQAKVFAKLYQDAHDLFKKKETRALEEQQRVTCTFAPDIQSTQARAGGSSCPTEGSVFARLYQLKPPATAAAIAMQAKQISAHKTTRKFSGKAGKAVTERLFQEAAILQKKKEQRESKRKQKMEEFLKKVCLFGPTSAEMPQSSRPSSKAVTERLYKQAQLDAEQRKERNKTERAKRAALSRKTVKANKSPQHERLYNATSRRSSSLPESTTEQAAPPTPPIRA